MNKILRTVPADGYVNLKVDCPGCGQRKKVHIDGLQSNGRPKAIDDRCEQCGMELYVVPPLVWWEEPLGLERAS